MLSACKEAFAKSSTYARIMLQVMLVNCVNTKCRPSKLIAIPFCKIIIDALGQGAHCFVSFFYY